jgi:hypothetical protein
VIFFRITGAMTKKSGVDLSILSDPSNHSFMQELVNSRNLLHSAQASEFFETILSHFRDSRSLSVQQGNRILVTIQALLENDHHRDIFLSGNHALALPCEDADFASEVLNVFYTLVTKSAQGITTAIASAFAHLIPMDPGKCLILIATYATQFEDLPDPWGLVDLLIQNGPDFASPDLVSDYVRLLCFLCYEFTAYRAARVKHCWNRILSMLAADDLVTIGCCYNGLCALARFNRDGTLDKDVVSLHLRSQETVESALSIFSMRQIHPHTFSQYAEFIPSLIHAATYTVHATLILMDIAKFERGAAKLLEDREWLRLPLPTFADTARLFLMVFHHKPLRPKFFSHPHFVPFLRTLLRFKNAGMLAIVATVLRGMPLKPDDIGQISRLRLFRDFANVANALRDEISIGAALLVALVIARLAYVSDLVAFCDIVASCVVSGGHLARQAGIVASCMAKYRECSSRLARFGIEPALEDPHGPRTASRARRSVSPRPQRT